MLCRSRSVKALFDCVGVQGFWGFTVCRALVLGSHCFGVPWQFCLCLSCCGTQMRAGHRTKEGLSITKQPLSSLALGNSCSFHSSHFGGLGRSATLFELPCLGYTFGRPDFLLILLHIAIQNPTLKANFAVTAPTFSVRASNQMPMPNPKRSM